MLSMVKRKHGEIFKGEYGRALVSSGRVQQVYQIRGG